MDITIDPLTHATHERIKRYAFIKEPTLLIRADDGSWHIAKGVKALMPHCHTHFAVLPWDDVMEDDVS